MNTELIDYGIREEKSHIRAHVSPQTKRVYVFRTSAVLHVIDEHEYKSVPAYQPGYDFPTATGYLVPVEDVPDLRVLAWQSQQWWLEFDERASTTEKGKRAVWVVRELMRLGRFPLWFDGEEVEDRQIDIDGTDILVAGKWRIQVKCDWKAGRRKDGGSGNLFIQIQECNPGRLH